MSKVYDKADKWHSMADIGRLKRPDNPYEKYIRFKASDWGLSEEELEALLEFSKCFWNTCLDNIDTGKRGDRIEEEAIRVCTKHNIGQQRFVELIRLWKAK